MEPQTRQDRGRALEEERTCRFIDSEQFRALLVSKGELERADDRSAGMRGLRDRRTGIVYVIEEKRLFERDWIEPHRAAASSDSAGGFSPTA